ncbi:hypothetical protein RchiOBHm_Chr1g0318991 [Rosa chinensis]|uniref:Uncharacterized protein n=1 Tax=Rosa chinensis TaxID=74649 RepID=A0A2P6S8E4_ROSCH|nr:uncharacterized protein LOC112201253 [Rosa chinensis]PRQ54924.1 hypothetical protein RchiOBHm_Chr1g0318991 [Rosa chinensis]
MSLVDYASSDDDVSEEEEDKENKENEPAQVAMDEPHPPTRPPHTQSVVSSYQQSESTAYSSAPSVEKLPDASQLFGSSEFSSNMLSGNYQSSLVGAESASRKRESNSFASPIPRSKVPRGNLPHSRNVPDTLGGMLVPPQLSGRSNIVTEDVSKLFVKKQGGSPQ